MKFNLAVVVSVLVGAAASSAIDTAAMSDPAARDIGTARDASSGATADELWKRRGGGGGGARGGSSGGSSRGGSSGSSGSSRGSSGSGSKSSSSSNRANSPSNYVNTRSTSNTGGYSKPGSGPQPGFAGGTRYGGGAKAPYAAGRSTPSGVVAGAAVGGAAIAFWPGTWHTPVYMYGPYGYHYGYHNSSSNRHEERDIICSCAQYSECMCDEIEDDEFWDELIGDGDYDKLNKSLVDVTRRNGRETIVVNGTLPNGTTAKSDNEDDYKEYLTNAAARLASAAGVWPAAALAISAVVLF